MIAKLHYITQDINGLSHAQHAEATCKSGIDWLQLRVKNKPHDEWLDIAYEVRKICTKYSVKFIVNDNVEIARLSAADGVHLGKNDLDPVEARIILGNNFIIGGTANTFADVKRLVHAEVNYIGLGPFRFTRTKKKLSPVLGMEGYINIMQQCRQAAITTPIIAIGGITPADVDEIMKTSVHGVAVSSCINLSSDRDTIIEAFRSKGLVDSSPKPMCKLISGTI